MADEHHDTAELATDKLFDADAAFRDISSLLARSVMLSPDRQRSSSLSLATEVSAPTSSAPPSFLA